MTFPRHCIAFLAALLLTASAAWSDPLPLGDGEVTAQISDVSFRIYSYRPACPVRGMLLVFHGLSRDADSYRDHARKLADQMCFVVLAPLFDDHTFPVWRYQKGGIVKSGALQDPRTWPGRYVLGIVQWAQQQEGKPLPYSLVGHSAGAQFLSRVAAFTSTQAHRIVIANPSTYVLATTDVKAPFGMGGVYPEDRAQEELRRYLTAPVTILLGENDEGSENRDDSAEAVQQGETRYARGLNTFHAAQALAQSRGWAFNWRLVTVPNVGHSAGHMFESPEALQALQ
jgi:pimeloyl-ACP methyl ester carboxylesterase